jgi:hypothetical protein
MRKSVVKKMVLFACLGPNRLRNNVHISGKRGVVDHFRRHLTTRP